MFTLLVVLHVIFCVFLILVILLQTGKGGGMGAAFGGASQTVFGPRGAGSFIGKLTGIVAALFMLTSLVLAYMSSSGNSGVADKVSALNDERAKDVESVDLTEAQTPTDETDLDAEEKAQDGGAKQEAPPSPSPLNGEESKSLSDTKTPKAKPVQPAEAKPKKGEESKAQNETPEPKAKPSQLPEAAPKKEADTPSEPQPDSPVTP